MKKSILLFILLLSALTELDACTSFIISGRITPDGRPLLFKNRDTEDLNNHLVVIQGARYRFEGVTGDRDKNANNIWMGHNEAGFAIMNTAAYNLNGKRKDVIENDGKVMRRALEICATLKDFEHFLDTLKCPRHLDSNFGVIDAEGGCAYYEAGDSSYVKYDVNDPDIAPNGYLVRTNHAMSGDRSMDKGIERYLAISDLMNRNYYSGKLSAEELITSVPRYLTHGLTHVNLLENIPADTTEHVMVNFTDFIPRYLTSSAVLYQGVKKGENPLHTIAWTIIGNPLTTVVVPIIGFDHLPKILTGNNRNQSELCQKGMSRKNILFPYSKGNGRNYLDRARLVNKAGTGILQQVQLSERFILQHAVEPINSMRSNDRDFTKKLYAFYQWIDDNQNQW